MIEGAGRLRRALGCVAGAAIVGVPSGLIAMVVAREQGWFVDDHTLEMVVVLPLCVGLGAVLGLEVATAGMVRSATLMARVWVGSIALVSLIMSGVWVAALVSVLLETFTQRDNVVALVGTVLAVACVGFGVAAAVVVASWRVENALRAVPLCAVLGVLYSLGLNASWFMASSPIYHCLPRASWCIEYARRQQLLRLLSLPAIVPGALPVGIWLGIVLWVALALGRRAAAARLALRAS